ncbi:Methionine adenosyltransferase 2 subunit beta [Neolecta irregularis DAH-3]|uniref:Methionine adenosyltransferase 2 subunit beta n=1 Tax=Neolecta irregularis (strain DAH-3) TaxID=1198029 RepID=A0A1U7LJS0_NEOID|nr:Methionine adenosyltransferase 2 subunit beta [Neolecta irregularis DAH-3]|eukprot:OLL22889.1 Methionine adenosyltransferase 2 subunit beta [Neolecta irregularis DAH-3]
MPSNVVITGASGLLGRAVFKAFKDSPHWNPYGIAYSRPSPPDIQKVDITDHVELASYISHVKPRAIVHCAAERRPDICEDPHQRERTQKLNVEASRKLAESAKEQDALLIYISTDFVFNGRNAPYSERDETDPLNVYSISKRKGELAVLEVHEKAIILRVPVLYGEVERNNESAVNTLVDAVMNVQMKKQVDVDHYYRRYPTNTSDVGRVIHQLCEKLAFQKIHLECRIFHFTADEMFTKYDMCVIFGEIMAVPINHLRNIDTIDKEASTPRPYDTHLQMNNLERLGIDVSSVPFKEWWKRFGFKAYKH